MKEYVILTVQNETLIFNYKTITNTEKMHVNTNSFYEDSLYYTLKKYKLNKTKIASFLCMKCPNISVLKINRLVTFKYLIDLIKKNNIEKLDLNFSSTIDAEDYNLFLSCESIKQFNCYYMSSDILSKFKEKDIEVTTATTSFISEKFMNMLNLDNKDFFYYKKVITIKEDYKELISDLREFLKINYKLKAIHICVYSKELISDIVELVKHDESRNVVIFLHQEYDKGNFIENNFKWLKDLSDKCNDEYTCEFRILYSNSFLSKNLFKQLTFNNLKLIFILCIYVSIVSLVLIKSYEYIDEMSIQNLNNQLANNIEKIEEEERLNDEDQPLEEQITEEEIKTKYTFTNSFKKLKKINKETVGYLVVKNTQISYPVVQHSDNNYYLKRDIYKHKTGMGWIYLDYRNNIEELNDNSIIYGHSMLNGTMFGTLKKVLDSSWRKEEDNMIIDLSTPKKTYKFKIFAVYKVDYTTDYLVTNFETKKEKEAFIKLIKKRNSIKTSTKVTSDDKILTLSTCTGSNNKRLVVHAVLMEESK